MINSGKDDKAALRLRDANALPRLAPIYKALPGFFKTIFAIFFEALSPFLPRFLRNSPRTSACIVLALTVIDCFLIHIQQ